MIYIVVYINDVGKLQTITFDNRKEAIAYLDKYECPSYLITAIEGTLMEDFT